ncbi:MAG: 30S ribosome-binding factor RbfA [Patescibacteria group bacterium]|nr:30S ribosome-binding factor RbfA [Patescibacteria group bacterium]MDE2438845.1 30S ribosome-binding factor RbfA [Patescibacteria group bacterium]
MSRRTERVNELIREEVGTILLKDVTLPGNFLITITNVDTSRDLRNAAIYYSVIPDSAVREVKVFLDEVAGDIQHILNRRLKMYPIPHLRFVYDPREKEAARLDELLKQDRA